METITGNESGDNLTQSGIRLLAPGYQGQFDVVRPGMTRSQTLNLTSVNLTSAANANDINLIDEIVFDLKPQAQTKSANNTRSRGKSSDSLQLEVPDKSQGDKQYQYAVLHFDENGIQQWILPEANKGKRSVRFQLPQPTTAQDGETGGNEGKRGKITKAMRFGIKIVSWLLEPLTHSTAQFIASKWEKKHRPYALVQVNESGLFRTPDWHSFTGPKALLLIHGTFSTSEAAFDGMFNTPEFQHLTEYYQGQVLAFSHPSLSQSPEENVQTLLGELPHTLPLSEGIDVICHSRGGLVTRELNAALQQRGDYQLRRICQVGVPNKGTLLTDSKYWISFIDAYTNCLTKLPDSTTTVVLEGILCLVKVLGAGVVDGLPGLSAMQPAGEWQSRAAKFEKRETLWYTVGANYEPSSRIAESFLEKLKAKALNTAADSFFKAHNDLVVPLDGCHSPFTNSASDDLKEFKGEDVSHVTYFKNRDLLRQLVQWLSSGST